MYEYKALKCDVSKLVSCDKTKEEFIMSNFISSVIDWAIDINDGYVTIEETNEDKISYVKMKITDWDYYKKSYPMLENKWYSETIIGFESKMNELGSQNYKLVSSQNNVFIFMKEA